MRSGSIARSRDPKPSPQRKRRMIRITRPFLPVFVACALFATATALAAKCAVRDGVIADVSPGPFLPSTETVTLKGTYSAEFRWDINDKEGIGWMRITDAHNREIGWVPSGHEGVRCGENN